MTIKDTEREMFSWELCDHCKPSKNALDRWGPHQFPIDGNEIYCYDTDNGWEGEEINYCPWCGRPLTEKAWDELEKKIGFNKESAKKRNEEAEKTLERVRQILSDPLIINDPQNPKMLRPVKRTSRQDVYTTLLKAQKAAGISDRWFPEEWNKK